MALYGRLARFLEGFHWASLQIEGTWNEDGKGDDRHTHTPENGDTGDVAIDPISLTDIAVIRRRLQSILYKCLLTRGWNAGCCDDSPHDGDRHRRADPDAIKRIS